MVRAGPDPAGELAGAAASGADGWRQRFEPSEVAFVALWATGGDVHRDGLFRLHALRFDPRERAWSSFQRWCVPFPGAPPGEGPATARMAAEFGVTARDLEGAHDPREAWSALERFLDGAPRIVLDRTSYAAWAEHLGGGADAPALDPADLSALFAPGGGDPLRHLEGCGRGAPGPVSALGGRELAAVAAAIVGGLAAGPRSARLLAARGYGAAWDKLRAEDERAADRLALALGLADRPTAWASAAEELFSVPGGLADGALSEFAGGGPGGLVRLAGLEPGWATASRAWLQAEPVPPRSPEAAPLDGEEREAIDRVFSELLPRHFRGQAEAADPRAGPGYRAGQHAVAGELARHFGAEELFLVHAPTGTGKTLAYLVPAILWAARRGVRVGVATYTRALQEQAMRHDVPLALRLLQEATPDVRARVSLLKGRPNYLCWSALAAEAPSGADTGARHLSWTALALFAVTDSEGDLDRFPLRPPLLEPAPRVLSTHAALVRATRAHAECCTRTEDRARCGAEVARRRAERSHLVVTNQSFALARQEFFRHLVFDECEHLHEQAHQAWSRHFDLAGAKRLVERVWRSGPQGHATPLGRAAAAAGLQGPASALVRESMDRAGGALAARDRLERAVLAFDEWRDAALRSRQERDSHSLLREFLALDESVELQAAHAELLGELVGLTAGLAGLAEHWDALELAGRGRLRRSLDLVRSDLEEAVESLAAWMPRESGAVRLRPEIFYDVERDERGRALLAARVLLPHEHLGRLYYPQLSGAAFVSATTFLRGGFDAAACYLGLTRAAEPEADEDREPLALRSYRAPETFDYGRVLTCVPRDAPPVRGDKNAFLEYVKRFVAWLGERTRGRLLVLFTNAEDCRRVGESLRAGFAERRLPLLYQRMDGAGKEELGELFRRRVDATLLGLDTFWYGADFPGQTLEYLVLVRLPYGVPDRYHHAQCAVLGRAQQRRAIYVPRALAKFRQGFGRLMRKESDRGCVFLLDGRVLEPRHRMFLGELPLGDPWADEHARGMRLVRGDTERCLREALAHMGMLADVRRRGLDLSFAGAAAAVEPERPWNPDAGEHTDAFPVREEDLPF